METIKELQKLDINILAKYILNNFNAVSHLKLQKLLFYCDAYHLAYFENELTEDKFQAWVHGPVSTTIYNTYKDYSLYIDIKVEKDPIINKNVKSILTTDQFSLINDVLEELSTWSGLELESSTHDEYPWIEARKGFSPGDKCTKEISKETTLNFYKKELSESH